MCVQNGAQGAVENVAGEKRVAGEEEHAVGGAGAAGKRGGVGAAVVDARPVASACFAAGAAGEFDVSAASDAADVNGVVGVADATDVLGVTDATGGLGHACSEPGYFVRPERGSLIRVKEHLAELGGEVEE